MLFDDESLVAKLRHLDEPLRMPGFVEDVVADYLPDLATIRPLPRIWEPGGGATLYRLDSPQGSALLKVKHRDCTVESRLESEPGWMRVPSLENEHRVLSALDEGWSPRPVFFAEREGYQFLALEWLAPFHQAVERMDAFQVLAAWRAIERAVRSLYLRQIVHTDIHEHNLCFRGDDPVLCDFEEARHLAQSEPFEASLDVLGENAHGNVGDFPAEHGGPPGRTCLARLERVFRALVAERLPKALAECPFDADCPFNADELQEPEDRVYQSVAVGGLCLAGQRPQDDLRHDVFRYLLVRMMVAGVPVRHLDVGSNLGSFCLAAVRLRGVEESVGVEAFGPYVQCARALAFALGARRVRYETAVCGQDPLTALLDRADLVTVLSVYHHIRERTAFLRELKLLRPRQVLFELATQERYYPRSGGLAQEMEQIGRKLEMGCREVVATSSDYQRPIVLYSRDPLSRADRLCLRLLGGRFRAAARRLLGAVERRWLTREEP